MGYPVVHFQIEGADAARLRDFYAELFGWEAGTPQGPAHYAMLPAEAVAGPPMSGAISRTPEVPSSTWRGPTRAEGYPGHVTIYVAVPDVEGCLRRAESLGGRRMLGPDPMMPGVETALLADPEGHLIGLVTASEAPPEEAR